MEKRSQQKQTRDIPTSKTPHQKRFDVQRSNLQAKDAGLSRPQNKPEATRMSTSNPKDLKSKSGKHSASSHSDAILQVNQTAWEKHHNAYNSRQRPTSSALLAWRQTMQRHPSRSSLGGRSFNPSLRREIPALAGGGGNPDDSSSQQQGTSQEWSRVYGHDASGNAYARTEKVDREPQDRSAKPDSVSNEELLRQSVEANIRSGIDSYNNRN